MLILSLLILQVLPVSFCYDIELRGSLNIANNLFESGALRQPSQLVRSILSYLPTKIEGKGNLPRADTIAIPFLTTSNKVKKVEKPQLQTPLESILEALPYLLRSKNTKETLRQKENTSDSLEEQDSRLKLEEFMKHLKQTGNETIENVAFYIKKELNIKKNISHIIKIVTDDYTNMLQNYYDYVKKNINDYDRDLLYLDMISTSHGLLFNEENKLLNDIVMHEDHNQPVHNEGYQRIYKDLLRFSYIYKRDTMRYVYDKYKICKEYPAITEYGADLINEVLMLSDQQFIKIMQTLAKILQENDEIIAEIAAKKDRDLWQANLKNCTSDLFATKEYIALIRSVISQRFKPITSGSEEFKVTIKAAKMLLDIMDKALNVEEDWITLELDHSIRAIISWKDHKRDDIDEILEEFAYSLIERLEHNLTKTARKEIKILITAIMRGNTADFQRLLKNGSKYLQCTDFDPDLHLII